MVSRGSSAWRAQHWGPGCDDKLIVTVPWIISAGKIQCHRDAVTAFRAVGRVMHRHGYVIRSHVTGSYNCRKITGGTSLSSHAQGIGLDTNWDTNPYRKDKLITDMPRPMIDEIEDLKTDKGVLVCRWGGDWDGRPETPHTNYDAMHWEIMATPAELKAGFTIPDLNPFDNRTWPLLARGEKGPAVKRLQKVLKIVDDGVFGGDTEIMLKKYQASHGLTVDGWCGLGTWTALLTAAPKGITATKEQKPCP